MRPTLLTAILLLGLLLANSAVLVNSTHGPVYRNSISPGIKLLGSNATTTEISTQPLPFTLAGIWEDSGGDTCADCTYDVTFQNSGPNVFFLAAFYQTDPSCPAAIGQELFNLDINSNGTMLNDAPGYTNMTLCTRASNPVVADCGQDAIWHTPYNLTVTQNSISGEYQGQYWTWNTDTNGAISDCHIDHYYSQSFTLTPVFNSTSVSNSATSQQQNTGPTNTPPGQAGSTSSQSSSKSTTNSSTSTTTTKTGTSPLGIEILGGAAVLVILIVTGVIFLRKRQ